MESGKQLGSEAAGGRRRRSEAFWREAIERQRDSGLTQQGFCDREGLVLSTFTRWCQRLSERTATQAGQSETQFVQLRPAAVTAEPIGERAVVHVRLDLGAGVSIEIVRH